MKILEDVITHNHKQTFFCSNVYITYTLNSLYTLKKVKRSLTRPTKNGFSPMSTQDCVIDRPPMMFPPFSQVNEPVKQRNYFRPIMGDWPLMCLLPQFGRRPTMRALTAGWDSSVCCVAELAMLSLLVVGGIKAHRQTYSPAN